MLIKNFNGNAESMKALNWNSVSKQSIPFLQFAGRNKAGKVNTKLIIESKNY